MRLILVSLALALAGCAAPARPYRPPVEITEAPTCNSKVTCQRMWLAAQESAQALTGMRLRMVTDTRIETFAPTTFGRSGATIVMYPMSANVYEIRADFECYRNSDCSDIRPLGINAFNARVKMSAR